MPLHFRDYKPTDQIYTHVLPDGTNVNIDSIRLRAWCIAMRPPIKLLPVDQKQAQSYLRDNVVSMDRCLQLLTKDKLDPIIFAKDGQFTNGLPDAFHVDGHHRYALAGMCGLRFIPSHLLELHEWKPFQIEGVPPITREFLEAMPVTARSY